jgi:hypothetical protein
MDFKIILGLIRRSYGYSFDYHHAKLTERVVALYTNPVMELRSKLY